MVKESKVLKKEGASVCFKTQVGVLQSRDKPRIVYGLGEDESKMRNSAVRKRNLLDKEDCLDLDMARLSKEDKSRLLNFMRFKIDKDVFDHIFKAPKFLASLDILTIEAWIGKALLAGDLELGKYFLEKARKNSRFQKVGVSNAFFLDMRKRGRRSTFDETNHRWLLIMTLIRQGDRDIINFALDNYRDTQDPELSSGEILKHALSKDGDMTFSNWKEEREVDEMTTEDKLNDLMPKTKIFDTFFEYESPLTAVLRNGDAGKSVGSGGDEGIQKSRRSVRGRKQSKRNLRKSKSVLDDLLSRGADPREFHHQAFKLAARYGLKNELKTMLTYVKGDKKNQQEGAASMDHILVAVIAHAAIENQMGVIKFVRKTVEGVATMNGGKSSKRVNNFIKLIKKAVDSLVEDGKELICTYRFRLLNGIYNLLNIQHEVKMELKNGSTRENQANFQRQGSFPEAQMDFSPNVIGLNNERKNDWVKAKTSKLSKNEVTDYQAAAKAMIDPVNGTFAVKLNVTVKARGVDDGDTSSVVSGASAATDLNGLSGSTRTTRGATLSGRDMFEWFTNILLQNDYGGENMSMVLFALGLKEFMQPHKAKKKGSDTQSEASSAFEGSVVSGAESEFQSDAGTDISAGDDDARSMAGRGIGARLVNGMRKSLSRVSTSIKKRRRSTLADVVEFFGDMTNQVKDKVSRKNKRLSSKEKVLALSLAAGSGFEKVLNVILDLVATNVDFNLLKCLYVAAEDGNTQCCRLVLQRVTDHFEILLDDSPIRGSVNYNTTVIGMRRRKGKSAKQAFIEHVVRFLQELEKSKNAGVPARDYKNKKLRQTKQNVYQKTMKRRARKKSIVNVLADNAGNRARQASGYFSNLFKGSNRNRNGTLASGRSSGSSMEAPGFAKISKLTKSVRNVRKSMGRNLGIGGNKKGASIFGNERTQRRRMNPESQNVHKSRAGGRNGIAQLSGAARLKRMGANLTERERLELAFEELLKPLFKHALHKLAWLAVDAIIDSKYMDSKVAGEMISARFIQLVMKSSGTRIGSNAMEKLLKIHSKMLEKNSKGIITVREMMRRMLEEFFSSTTKPILGARTAMLVYCNKLEKRQQTFKDDDFMWYVKKASGDDLNDYDWWGELTTSFITLFDYKHSELKDRIPLEMNKLGLTKKVHPDLIHTLESKVPNWKGQFKGVKKRSKNLSRRNTTRNLLSFGKEKNKFDRTGYGNSRGRS